MSNYLCEELIVEIFTKLPPKSLLRFRSLSKSWYSCIGSPGFIRMHTFRSPKKLLFRHKHRTRDEKEDSEDFFTLHSRDQLPFCPKRGYIGIKSFEFPCKRRSNIIIGSHNGILCLFDDEEKSITPWNPSIRHKLTLPDCSNQKYFTWIGIGFGFDPITDDYMIVSIPYFCEGNLSSYVYTLKTGTWCAIASPMSLFYQMASKAHFVNGALHWMVQLYYNVSHDVDAFRILTFDLSTQVFGMIPLPDSGQRIQYDLAVFGRSLAVISTDDDDGIKISVRRDDSWCVVYKSKTNLVGGGIDGVVEHGDYLLAKPSFLGGMKKAD
ncbi:hypothetical protein L1887_02934 [Cichorium endivia]|nr:hypothetical protein L1887_02934 [Cichorium endivia]